MSSIRFIMLGGFLGAGKTTTIARLARTYQEQGLRVGVVTNDQAANLVDTHLLRSQGFDVGEVAGACFCCKFNDLTDTISRLEADQRPDVVLAEPVGSCTDLVATVMQPIMALYGEKFDVAPYGVLLKPSHGRRILSGDPKAGFSPKAAYIFKKQLEEADFIVINRIDELDGEEVDELAGMIDAERPGVPILRASARTGEGFDALVETLDQRGAFGKNILDIDYDIYAEGEAELGWLNANVRITAAEQFSLDDLLVDIIGRLRTSLAAAGAETAHLKAIGLWEGYHGVANLVSRDAPAELSLASDCRTKIADVVINARVATSPDSLQRHVEDAVAAACDALNAEGEFQNIQCLSPGRPTPTHRYSATS
ncbi:MAG: cobalamin biosynthesis protein P47K [Planctomycetes bacterium]|nr:cobalamin biosynthesis protein P47K [Planctomycetota bacterium]